MSKNRLALFAFGTALCAAATSAVAGNGQNLTHLIAADTQVLFVIDVAGARDSPILLQGYQKLLAAKPDVRTKIAAFGIDPIKDIETVMFAGGGVKKLDDLGKAKSTVVIIEGNLPADKLLSAMPGAQKTAHKGVEIWAKDDSEAALIDGRLFFTKKGQMKNSIEIALGKAKGRSVAGSKKAASLRDAIAGTDTAAHLWMSMLIPAENQAKMKADAQGLTFVSVGAGVRFGTDVKISLRVTSSDETGAKKAHEVILAALGQVTQGLGQFGLEKAAQSLKVSQDKTALNFAVTVTEAEINTILAFANKTFGAEATAEPAAEASPVEPAKTPKKKSKKKKAGIQP